MTDVFNYHNLSEYDQRKVDQARELADLLENKVNGGNPYELGKNIGQFLTRTHRTLQGNIVKFILGIVESLSEQEHTDARNKQAIEACRIITEQARNGDIPWQPLI